MRARRSQHPLLAVLAAAGVVCALNACTAPARGQIDLPPKNETQWSLPLDQFSYAQRGPLRDYAEALLEQPCYAKHGVDWPVPWQPTERDLGASVSAGGAVILNVALATQYGYHHAPRVYENSAAWLKFVEVANTTDPPGFDAIMRECQAGSSRALPRPSQADIDYASIAAQQSYEEALLVPRVVSAAQQWGHCMSDAGYGGMAASPDAMPPEDRVEAWQVGIPFTAAGAEEISVASADAACRSNSGWSSALYAEEWDRQAKFVSKHASKLLRIRAELAEEKRLLLDAVAKNAPARP